MEAEIPIIIDAVTAICIIGAIQLATRHPKFIGPSRVVTENFARELQAIVVEKFPETGATLAMGWDPNFDLG